MVEKRCNDGDACMREAVRLVTERATGVRRPAIWGSMPGLGRRTREVERTQRAAFPGNARGSPDQEA